MEYGIIFEGDTTPLAAELSESLKLLGFLNGTRDTLNGELLSALNSFRAANYLPELDFCDPVVLRVLGIDVRGDELMTVAACAASEGETELDYYDISAAIINESRSLGISLTEAAARRGGHPKAADISKSAMLAAVLAFINQ